MVKRMLIDASHAEETRVVVANGTRLEEFDFESAARKQLKGNIYLAKVMRVEPSLQAAFVDYGGNRHGFLPFSEIHPDYYQIPVADREALFREQEAAPDPDDVEDDAQAIDTEIEPDAQSDEIDGDVDVIQADAREDGSGQADVSSEPDPESLSDAKPSEIDAKPEAATASNEVDNDAESKPKGAGALEDTAPGTNPRTIETSAKDEPEKSAVGNDDTSNGSGVLASAETDNGENVGTDNDDTQTTVAAAAAAPSISTEPRSGSSRRRKRKTTSSEGVEEIGGDEIEDIERRRSSISRSLLSRRYRIQEVIKKRQIILVQVVKEERGNKGAALTSYLSLAGRYCVLMPNAVRGGGISRKITSQEDRKRLKSILTELQIPSRMGVIVRTAGTARSKAEIRRDFEYLMRQWEKIREQTLTSIAPKLIYEEGNLIKRSIRDLYARDVDEILVEGEEGYRVAKDFMRMLIPSHTSKVQPYRNRIPLFSRYQIESQLDSMYSPDVQLKSGGYLVINLTEALVAIDVNSGRATRERNIEETAVNTNLEAAAEVARQLRLRDLAGLIVIDFIDMDDNRNQRAVERKMKESMRVDRARIQIGRISPFGLMEMSRQRLRPSLMEASMELCNGCSGAGVVRSVGSSAVHALRAVEEEGLRSRSAKIRVHLPSQVAYYILNNKRKQLAELEEQCLFEVDFAADDTLVPPMYNIERLLAREDGDAVEPPEPIPDIDASPTPENSEDEGGPERKKRRRRRRSRRDDTVSRNDTKSVENATETLESIDAASTEASTSETGEDGALSTPRKRRRRGKRGGRRRSAKRNAESNAAENSASEDNNESDAGDSEATTSATTSADTHETSEFEVSNSGAGAATSETAEAKPKSAKPRRRRSHSQSKPTAETAAPSVADGDNSSPATDSAEKPDDMVAPVATNVSVQPQSDAPVGASTEAPVATVTESDTQPDAAEPSSGTARRGWWQRKSANKKEAD